MEERTPSSAPAVSRMWKPVARAPRTRRPGLHVSSWASRFDESAGL